MYKDIGEKEFQFRPKDFETIKAILYAKSGIRLSDTKDSMVYSRLARRLRQLKINSFALYLDYLNEAPDEEQEFINALTTNLTSFFREKHHFPILREFLEKYPGKKNIWCAASSTGEEPYSIAMTVAETFGKFSTEVKIIASDIDSVVLDKASKGIYPLKNIENLSLSQRQQFFLKGKRNNQDNVKVVPELRQMVSFRQLNLMDNEWHIKSPIDVIFCRNVMIYFDKSTQLNILARMVDLMSPNGIYIAGHSENFANAGHLVSLLGKTVYRPNKGNK